MTDLDWLAEDDRPDEGDAVVMEWEMITALRQTTLTLGEEYTYNLVMSHTQTRIEHGGGRLSQNDAGYALSLALGTANQQEGKTVFGKPLTLLAVPAGISNPDLPLGPMGEKTYEMLAYFMQEGRQVDLESVANAVAAYYGNVPNAYPDSHAKRLEFNENLGMMRAAMFDGSSEVAVEAARRAARFLPGPFADVQHTAAARTSVAPWTPLPVAQAAWGPADGAGMPP